MQPKDRQVICNSTDNIIFDIPSVYHLIITSCPFSTDLDEGLSRKLDLVRLLLVEQTIKRFNKHVEVSFLNKEI